MFDLLAVFFALVIATKGRGAASFKYWVFCGLSIAGAFTVDYVNAILIPVILGFFLASEYLHYDSAKATRRLRNYFAFLASSGLGVAFIAAYNFLNFGTPFTSSEQLYLHSETLVGNFDYPIWNGVILNLFTPFRGLFVFCPVLILGALGFYFMIRQKRIPPEHSYFILAVFLGLLLPYSAWYEPMGGLSYGARLIVPAIPFLLIPAGSFLERGTKWRSWLVAYGLYIVSAFINGVAAFVSALGPGDPPAGHTVWTYFAFVSSSPSNTATLWSFLNGAIDSWWNNSWSLASNWWMVALPIIGITLFLPLIFCRPHGKQKVSEERKEQILELVQTAARDKSLS
jgi:hypothetical protein